VLYDDTTVVTAMTLQAAPASLHHTGRNVQPSARYLGLLQAGKLVQDPAVVCICVLRLLVVCTCHANTIAGATSQPADAKPATTGADRKVGPAPRLTAS
jgi:hypothetical protein